MARQPYFSGNYGSALAQIDTRPIMQGAAAQAAMYQGLGQNIGGAIEKYQLNKEKREKEESTAMGTLAGMSPEERSQFIQGNPKLEKAVESALSDTAKPADFSMINSGTAPFLAGRTRGLERDLKETQAESAALALRMAKELEGTTIQVQKDKATISSLSTAIAKETNPQRKELLQGQLASAIADLGENPAKRAERIAQREEAAATRQALGGPKGVGELAARGATAKVKLAEGSVGEQEAKAYYYKSSADAKKMEAYGKLNPSFKLKYDKLESVKKTLLSDTVETPQGERVTFKKYKELHLDDPKKYPMTGTAADLDGMLKSYDKQIQTLMQGEFVQVNDTSGGAGAVGGAAAPGLPSAISPGDTPAQAATKKTARIAEIRTLIDNLNTEEANLGAPGQSMTTYPVAGGMGGSAPTTAPQTVGHISQREQQIPIEREALRAELTQLANTNY